ncbi:MAG: class I SAM-dependent DNA methyltransferase, partial [Gammaproteobacteria bacterium]
MPLSWNEIRGRALAFSNEWAEARSESADAKPFWDAFFHVFGVTRRRVASFEQRVATTAGAGFIDLLWKGKLLIEHKSRGRNLDHAHAQALNYFSGIAERDLPRYVLVSDFARFRLYDLDDGGHHEFTIGELAKNINRFAFIAGYQTHALREQDPVNIEAAEAMGKLHDAMRANGYAGHALEMYLVRLLFCLFADNTGIFDEPQQFQFYIEDRTACDGSDLGAQLDTLFQVLNTRAHNRQRNLDEQLGAFPFINGILFEE